MLQHWQSALRLNRKERRLHYLTINISAEHFAILHSALLFECYNTGKVRYDWTERSAVYINMLYTHVVFKIANVGILRFSFAVDGRKLFISANRTCSTLIIRHWTNQILNLWRCHCRCCKTMHTSDIFCVTFLNDDLLSITLWCCLKSDTLISPVPHINTYQKENNWLRSIFINYSTRARWIWIDK